MGFKVKGGNSVLGYKLPADSYKETGKLEEHRQTLVDSRTALADDGLETIPQVGKQDTFKPKSVKVYNYSDECKEVMEIDYTGFGRSGGRKGNKSDEFSEEDRKRNLQRIKRNVRRLALSNDMGQVHVMLSFKENIQDADLTDRYFKKFIFDLRKFYPYLKYIATREYQVRGAIHYHVLLNQRVDIKKLNLCWNGQEVNRADHMHEDFRGWVDIVKHPTKLRAVMYVLKYIRKEVGETVMETAGGHTKKAYLSSQGLKKELEACTSSFLINNPMDYREYNDGLNFVMTNLTEGWDIPLEITMPDDKVIHGRSVLRCAANNY